MQLKITDELEALFSVLPPRIKEAIEKTNRSDELIEIVIDLGRLPEARFTDSEVALSDEEVSPDDIKFTVKHISKFTTDNRAGLERTLHRISAIRNRRGKIVGLTCRVGRAVYGTIDIIQDIVKSGQNILILGRPGIGKTTLLREAARELAENRRVVVVDTSNEIAGDGDIPHPAIGRARRMQVATPALQHEVMIEAVENHMPEVIIIDEIGRELEAAAARTIAERGVQLVGTAHGNTLENLLMNPTLCDLVGGIESVTLSDEEARRRGTQKSVLERKAPPTFDVLVEIHNRNTVAIHHDVAAAVDSLLRGKSMPTEIRYRHEDGSIKTKSTTIEPTLPEDLTMEELLPDVDEREMPQQRKLKPKKIYPYGVGQNRIRQAATALQLPVMLTDRVSNADVVVTLKGHYRKRPRPISDAEGEGIPVYVLRSNTVTQIESFLTDIFGLGVEDLDPYSIATREMQRAIQKVLSGTSYIELSPQSASIRRMQHEMARQASLVSHSRGREPHRRVRVYRDTL